ncbi:GNAT domain-containing protein [Dendryphion nanum]|uniref:GNAT domain-containing protein n=1 Tax=Dendryphion nanum TaxID=256645 RepID=A0A9P9IV59_9PLEO|nr:GNAT domain-containing protein [Dendryphion nanum]
MKINEHAAILTPTLLLVPYSEHHVPTYHEWMQDEDLQKATASEPLTLPEEYAMQKSWRTDADKLTFIVCNAPPKDDIKLEAGKQDHTKAMIGDVNLFLYEGEDEDEEVEEKNIRERQKLVGEIEIMIARKDMQEKGFGKVILLTFLWYILLSVDEIVKEWNEHLGTKTVASSLGYLRVKIGSENTRSIRLFEGVGFKKMSETPNYFGELELRWLISDESKSALEAKLANVPIVADYP